MKTVQGIVLRSIGGFYYVEAADKVYTCRARGIFRKQGITPVAGDRVTISVEEDGTGSGFFQQVEAAQEGGFAGAGGSDDDHLVAGINVLGNVLQNFVVAEGFAQMLNVYHFDAVSFPKVLPAR